MPDPLQTAILKLGGRFGPEKKYLDPPPPQIPQFAAVTVPAIRPLLETPPLLGFSIKNGPPPLLAPRTPPPLPLPEREKNKNIRNVHQERDCGRGLNLKGQKS